MGIYQPLADRCRPISFDQVVGQQHLVGEERGFRLSLDQGSVYSMILWGPPGSGKTTLARLIANCVDAEFIAISAVTSGIKDIRSAIETARAQKASGRSTILFVDEVHRFNKSQQDGFLPHIEDGTIVFIGATTENPSFELNNALLSRVRVHLLNALDDEAIKSVVRRALSDTERGVGKLKLTLSADALDALVKQADGDARRALNILEVVASLKSDEESREVDGNNIATAAGELLVRFDKRGDLFYEQISALHKAVRGSNPDGALYWFARMVEGGADPHYLARRLVRMAVEDIGNADLRALRLALDGWETYDRLGSPEGELALAQVVAYLAVAPKSNAVYRAFGSAMQDARESGAAAVPEHLRNAPTRLMKSMGYGKGYRYAHDEEGGFSSGQTYFPESLGERCYYHPVQRGLEIKIGQRLSELRAVDQKKGSKKVNN
ncbi:MAG: replication-associated recombination protein A [Arenicellales bacterium]|nr:replication-associated recombination protein A [Arenicellales bacterium]MDP7284280.1 replication-associated recombination protein A [Arenicellales bacterium]MDP7482353.1 replication-associated recombination protein A [Arenicellales bacterium]|tara:strand:- start:1141 stop:2454 length:1314 start_codon:yes stop_codon:yes gene_type:complete